MVCYKQRPFDPNSSGNDAQKETVTTNWSDFPDDLDTKLTGVRYEWLEYPALPEFEVQDPDHWVFANTGLGLNNAFGLYDNYQQTVVGPETDHRITDITPPSFQLLAMVRVPYDGHQIEAA